MFPLAFDMVTLGLHFRFFTFVHACCLACCLFISVAYTHSYIPTPLPVWHSMWVTLELRRHGYAGWSCPSKSQVVLGYGPSGPYLHTHSITCIWTYLWQLFSHISNKEYKNSPYRHQQNDHNQHSTLSNPSYHDPQQRNHNQ